jgi:hypothetical protein
MPVCGWAVKHLAAPVGARGEQRHEFYCIAVRRGQARGSDHIEHKELMEGRQAHLPIFSGSLRQRQWPAFNLAEWRGYQSLVDWTAKDGRAP